MSHDAISPARCRGPEDDAAELGVGRRSARRRVPGQEGAPSAGSAGTAPPVRRPMLYEASLGGPAFRGPGGAEDPACPRGGAPGAAPPPLPAAAGPDPGRALPVGSGRERRSASLTAEIVTRMLMDAEGTCPARKRGAQCRAPDAKRERRRRAGQGRDRSHRGAEPCAKAANRPAKTPSPKPCREAQKPAPAAEIGEDLRPQPSTLPAPDPAGLEFPTASLGPSEPRNGSAGKPAAEAEPAGPPEPAPGRKAQAARRRKKPESGGAGGQRVGQHLAASRWRPVGRSRDRTVYVLGASKKAVRTCYRAVKRDRVVIRVRDTVLLRSEMNKRSLPHVAKISALWENPDTGDLTMSLLWYYRPKQTETTHNPGCYCESELFASRHKDVNSVACIDEKCFVLTFSEYCRFHARLRSREQRAEERTAIVPSPTRHPIPRHRRVPQHTDQELVFFCRTLYDFLRGQLVSNL
uniref:bromo adjacent homology domain-containing 1 protein-like n=1 Tax=Pristiophorus japonicus TaxID=55135 RepID=UPI00398F0317